MNSGNVLAWQVGFSKNAAKRAAKMPVREQEKLQLLLRDLRLNGPILPRWPNYSKLGAHRYHCHLSYKWVACWEVKDNRLRLIEIYYAGSREDAPYGN